MFSNLLSIFFEKKSDKIFFDNIKITIAPEVADIIIIGKANQLKIAPPSSVR